MRVWGYYITHTIFNSIKKLFKTWIAFFLIVGLFGAVVGLVAGTIASSVAGDKVEEIVQEEEVQQTISEMTDMAEEGLNVILGIDSKQFIELIISMIFLFVFFISLFFAKSLEQIFLPADINMLFSAPIKPQSVLLFRLVTNLGVQIIMSLFMLFMLPGMINSLHIPPTAAIVLVAAWVLVNVTGTLIQSLVYIISTYSGTLKTNSKIIAFAMFGAVIGVFAYNFVRMDRMTVTALAVSFTGRNSYWVPFWGWTRGMCMNAINGNNVMAYFFLALNIIGCVALAIIVSMIKVDFYEEAMISAERKAEIIQKAKEQKTGYVRTKDRSDRIKRDAFNKGSGANVFFFKTLYNRKRLSYFGILTNTMIFYIAAAGFGVFWAYKSDSKYSFYIILGLMIFVVFYRTMGNPLKEDVSKDFFAMIPAGAKTKLAWSLLGGVTNTFLDLIVPYIFSVIWFKIPVLDAVLWMLFMLAIDLYGTVVGTFIMMSVPVTLPNTVQTMIQIIFIYFGIVPAIVFIVVGIVLKMIPVFMPVGIVMNLILSFIFFNIIPKFMNNGRA